MSFEIIIPFLKPIEHLLADTTISEIMVNPDSSVWIEEEGHIVLQFGIRFDEGALLTGLEVIANRFGKKLDADSPIMNLRLPDGSRMAALIPPVVNPGPMMTIRKFTSRNFTIDDLIARGMLTAEIADTLIDHVRHGDNILIAGGVIVALIIAAFYFVFIGTRNQNSRLSNRPPIETIQPRQRTEPESMDRPRAHGKRFEHVDRGFDSSPPKSAATPSTSRSGKNQRPPPVRCA